PLPAEMTQHLEKPPTTVAASVAAPHWQLGHGIEFAAGSNFGSVNDMADIRGVWGIDIGLAGLKAIRLVYAESASQVLATAFDYIPHPKILSQPDANPDELIAQSLDTFLSRNPLQGDGVAISVPGQTALARFIQLPPVEASKVVEIVKYEARQQIP